MLTLIRGNDAYLVQQAATQAARGLLRINCSDEQSQELLERATRYTSLFGDHTIATHVDGPGVTAAIKKVIATTEKIADSIVVIESPKGQQLLSWIEAYCRGRGAAITPSALALIAQWIPSDFWRLSCELDKLIAHPGPITEQLVQELVRAPLEQSDPWTFSNAVRRNDKRGALKALWNALGDGMAPELLVGMFGAGLRPLITVGNERALIAHAALADLDYAAKQGRADTVDGMFATLAAL